MDRKSRESGQAVMEYTLIIALLSVTMMFLMLGLGKDIIAIAADRAAHLGDLA